MSFKFKKMRKVLYSYLFSMTILASAFGQYNNDRSGYHGDNFSLEGALDLFKQSYSLEDFERRLNREDTYINNLDLDDDRRIDYIRVEHRRFDRNFHAIVLQVPIGRNDVQDIAVIELEQVGNKKVDLQIVGDEDIFGNEIFVESYGDSQRDIYRWPVVQSILDNQYQVYNSPYRWQYYPSWWSPWNVVSWNVYRPRIVVFHNHYRVVRPRLIHVHNYYKPYRAYCNTVVVHSNRVRVVHEHAPINRPSYVHNTPKNDGYYGSRRNQSSSNTNRTYNGSRSNEGSNATNGGSDNDNRDRYRAENSGPRDRDNVRDRGDSGRTERPSAPVTKSRDYGNATPRYNESPKKQYSESSGNKENSGQRNQTYRNDESSSKQKSYEQPKSPKPRDNAENQSYKGNSAEKNKRNSGSQRDGGRPRN